LIGVFIPILLLLLTRLGALLVCRRGIVTADSVPTIIIQVVFAVYLFVMLRRVYFVSHWYGGLLAASIAWSFFHISLAVPILVVCRHPEVTLTTMPAALKGGRARQQHDQVSMQVSWCLESASVPLPPWRAC